MSDNTLPVSAVAKVLTQIISFPRPTICIHLAACYLLGALEKNGIAITEELAHAVVFCDDETALTEIEKLH